MVGKKLSTRETAVVFGLPLAAMTLRSTAQHIIGAAKEKRPLTVLPLTMNEIVTAEKDPRFKKILKQFDLLTPDGMPLVWLTKRKNEMTRRLYGPELMLKVLSQSQTPKLRHFLYGSTPKTLRLLESVLQKRFPKAIIAGSFAPPFRELTKQEKSEAAAALKKARPNIVWVGLGGKKQVLWIHHWKKHLPNMTFIAVGAAFDFIAGSKKQAPTWMRNAGLEWLFRFTQEPIRLWRRYINQFPQATALFAKELIS